MCIYIYTSDADTNLGVFLYLIQDGSEFCEPLIETAQLTLGQVLLFVPTEVIPLITTDLDPARA